MLLKNAFFQANSWLLETLKRYWKTVVWVEALALISKDGVTWWGQVTGSELAQTLGFFTVELAVVAVYVLTIPSIARDIEHKIPTSDCWGHSKKHVKQVTIESLRALGQIAIHTLLLFVPGVIKGLRLYFVSYITQFDEDYLAGKVDALKRSESLVKGQSWRVFLQLSVIWILTAWIPYVQGPISALGLLKNPIMILYLAVVVVIQVYTELIVFAYYLNLVKHHRSA